MLGEADIEKAMRLGEDSYVEFKDVSHNKYVLSRDSEKDVAKTIASFANAGGGHLIIGVEDQGGLTGVGTLKQADRIMHQVSQICQDRIRPALTCPIVKVEVRGLPVLVVEVPAFSPERPHLVDGLCYIRDANRSRPATRDEQKRVYESVNYHFDEQPVAGAGLADLDPAAVGTFVSTTGAIPPSNSDLLRYLQSLGCATPSGLPTVSGILFFGKDPQKWLLDARISAVRFPGTEMSGQILDRQEITGRLPDQLASARAFLERYVISPALKQGFERIEMGIPSEVLQEALHNAVIHRDYRASSQTLIFVFDDRVEVRNPGALLNQLTLDSIRIGGISQRRNPVICSLANRLRRAETVGMGVPQMIRVMSERRLPEPEFSMEAGQFRVVLRRSPAATK